MTQSVSTALARKLSAGQEEQGEKPRSVLRALRLAFARTAGDRIQLPLSVIGAKQSNRAPDDLTDAAGQDWLLLQLSNDDGMSAAVCMDMGAASAIVQVQTIGEVMSAPPAARDYTDTDAAMVAPLMEEALTRAVGLVEAATDRSSLSGYEFRARLVDLRSLTLAMVEDAYRVFELTVELGGGLRQGQISVLLPELPAEQGAGDTKPEELGPNLEQASGVVRAELNTVISRMSLPLATLSGLVVGDVLPLVGSRLDRAEVLTIDRTRAAVGRLGQCGGMRAVRLNEYAASSPEHSDTPDFLEARSNVARQEVLDEPAQASLSHSVVPSDSAAMSDIGKGLGFENPDQMVAEISQLAGLTGLGDKPSQT
ncbi:FliM/FliN family flagellar motor C-terminal domain-containing protein [Ruegeria sp. Ofav3-42]|uniref:FliM/FliN family flagellar motor C-terminal domain-containing protein n=1 Tax=Ruegeria sp. Ofav3-42 TaxID=2917759 RepID=UPI001EF71F40|nr:FliM/FliN family flagellar motor switch protein [Ruegeria sp. Ofav3-42]MCG7518831.1 FliM/FliN family flagellar motor switch protein [Ruegeria sp. Ofav3-42]